MLKEISNDLTSLSGIGELTAEKLIKSGIPTPIALATSNIRQLVTLGFPKRTAHKILDEARTQCNDLFGFVSSKDLVEAFLSREFLTTGTEEFDRILGGKGFETQRVYELYGPVGTGKSTLLHQLICTASLPKEQGGLGANTMYLDTDNDLSLTRLQQLAPRFGIDPKEILERVIRATPLSSDHLVFLCESALLPCTLKENVRLICLDTLATHFRAEYGAYRSTFEERNHKIAKILQALKKIASQINGVVIFVNNVRENLTGFGRPWRPWGDIWQQDSNVRIVARVNHTSKQTYSFGIEKAIALPPDHCVLKLTDTGFNDIPSKKDTTERSSSK